MTKWNKLGLRSWLLGAAAMAAIGAGLVGSQFRHVDIVVQGPKGRRQLSIWTLGSKVREILHKAGIHVGPHDVVAPKRTIVAGKPIVVHRGVPVTVVVGSKHTKVWTTKYGVPAVLALAAVKVAPLDLVKPGRHAQISGPTTVEVIRRWWVTRHVALKIPFAVHHQPDSFLEKGRSVTHVFGRDGLRINTVREFIQNGRVVKKVAVSSRRVDPSHAEIIYYGTAQPISRGGTVVQFSKILPMVSTAYWPDPAWSSGYTYTGLRAGYGIAAVDPSVIPLGTRLYIPGYGFAVAGDIGGAVVGDRIDLCYDDAQQAIDWGLRDVNVYVLGP